MDFHKINRNSTINYISTFNVKHETLIGNCIKRYKKYRNRAPLMPNQSKTKIALIKRN